MIRLIECARAQCLCSNKGILSDTKTRVLRLQGVSATSLQCFRSCRAMGARVDETGVLRAGFAAVEHSIVLSVEVRGRRPVRERILELRCAS
jgi:hypothetical protein